MHSLTQVWQRLGETHMPWVIEVHCGLEVTGLK